MDGISLASGVAGLITLALQVGHGLTEYVTAVKDKNKNIGELQSEILLLGDVLSKLKDLISDEEAKGRSFDADSVLRQATRDCTRRIERIGDKLRIKEGGKVARALDRLTWPFEQKEVSRLVDSLRRFHATFSFALTTQNCLILSKTAEDAEKILENVLTMSKQTSEMYLRMNMPADDVLEQSARIESFLKLLPLLREQAEEVNEINQTTKYLEEQAHERKKTDVLEWLLPKSALHKHRDAQANRARHTCQWFLAQETFLQWKTAKHQSQDLLCLGPPGAGKTVLASAVVDHLREANENNDDVAILHHYCSYAEEQTQTPTHLVRSLLRQLCHTGKLPSAVAEFYQRNRHDLEDVAFLQKLQVVMGRVMATFNSIYIVIDALDEAGSDQRRSELLKVLDTARNSTCKVYVFATTRPLPGISQHFENALTIDVVANEGDLWQFLSERINQHQDSEFIMDPMMKEEIISKLCANANGIFLLPKLQIDHILDQITRADLRRALNSLSHNLHDAFASTIDRIRSLSTARRELVFRTFLWVSHARRPLTITELQHALAVRFEDENFDSENIVMSRTILDSCCGLIELDQDQVVKFVHFSLEEYLLSADHGFFEQGDTTITRTCLKYLSFPWLKPLPSKSRNEFMLALEEIPLAIYATREWGNHAKKIAVDKYSDLAIPLLNQSLSLLAMARIRDFDAADLRKWGERMTAWAYSGGAGISLAAEFGLTSFVRLLVSQKAQPVLNARDFRLSTPLHHAAASGFTETCETLIAHGADMREVNAGGATPFFLAVHYKQLDTAKALLQYDRAQLDFPSRGKIFPLHRAVELESEAMITFLLQSGALVGAVDERHNTALHLACKRGQVKIASLLILAGADVNATGHDYFFPVDFAITGGHTPLVQYLIDQGADLNSLGRDSWRPIHRASRGGYTEIVKILLNHGASPATTDRRKITPLQLAARSGNIECAKTLVNHDQSLSLTLLQQKDKRGETAKQIAFTVARYDIYKYLRDIEYELLAANGTQIQIFDPTLPLCQAIEKSDLETVKSILRWSPALLNTESSSQLLPIHLAFQENNVHIATYLLELGADIQSRGYHGWTPLQIGAAIGSLDMIELAIAHNAPVNATSDSKQTALHKACSSGSIAAVRHLLEAGADPRAVNDREMTPLHVAAHQNFLEAVRELLKPQYAAEDLVLQPDNHKDLPRDWAERSGHLEMAIFLRAAEKRLKTYTYSRRSGNLLSPSASRVAVQMVRTNSQMSATSATSAGSRTHSRIPSLVDLADYENQAGQQAEMEPKSSPSMALSRLESWEAERRERRNSRSPAAEPAVADAAAPQLILEGNMK